ncbi:MAG: hypothetical protein GY821_03525 [Gammaproteobacteria bacterium]|nr:hypothetical protein [Gammaproteobacteria bacterium]
MKFTILIVKESRAGEQRVALVPDDVAKLSASGHKVYIEADAGVAAGCIRYKSTCNPNFSCQ